jgi:hypothetical protein
VPVRAVLVPMSTETPDTVEQWAPQFAFFAGTTNAKFTDAQILAMAVSPGGDWCNLCNAPVPEGELAERHVKQHGRELREWRKRRRREAEKRSISGLKAARAEKKLAAETINEPTEEDE